MDNQHRKIKGYRELSEEEIALMNEIKTMGPHIQDMIEKVQGYLTRQSAGTPMITAPLRDVEGNVRPENVERFRLNNAEPGRWASIAKTHFQEGLMALTRSVAQPDFF